MARPGLAFRYRQEMNLRRRRAFCFRLVIAVRPSQDKITIGGLCAGETMLPTRSDQAVAL